ncbi:MAG TPA: hypothetical protein VM911_16825, partial [Pyrinomonadaceae bacterium]|nr:hypothetical protein [Pyrinomonadaceae bacterium]
MDRNRERLVVWTVFPAVLLVYLCFPTKNYFFDGVDFAYTIESARRLSTSLVHPNHLIYNLVGYLIYKAVRAVGIETRALEVLRIANSLLAVLSAYVLFRILRTFVRSLYLCTALVLLFSFSATWWKFSTDANAYIPSVLFILISFYLALPTLKPRPLLVALTFSLGMCFHQLAVVFYPVLVAALFLQADQAGRRKGILNALYFSAAAFVITFVGYYYSFYLATTTLDFTRFMRWMTSFSPDGGFSFSAWNNLSYTVRGHARLFFGGRFNLLRGLINPLIVVLIAALAAAVLLLIFQLIRNYKKPDLQRARALISDLKHKPVALLSALWILVYLVFLFIWMPQHTFYRLFYLPAIIILAGLVLSFYEAARAASTTAPRRRQYRLALLVAALTLANFLFLIYPYAHAEKFPPLAFALEMNREWP